MSEGGLTPFAFHEENAQAELDGMEVRFGDDSHLLLDLDDEDSIARYRSLMPKMLELFGGRVVEEYESRSGKGHLHVVVALEHPCGVLFRIALQATLGSDPLREMLSLVRLRNGVPEPSRLFRPRRSGRTELLPF